MTWQKDASGAAFPEADETRRAAANSLPKIRNPLPFRKVSTSDITWMRAFAAELDERTLAAWALHLRNAHPLVNRHAYLWREFARLELRRRKRGGGAS